MIASYLNRIKDEINIEYGFKDEIPAVNLGPCGRFAKAFHAIWNRLFDEKVTVCFLFSPRGECEHVFIRLPDGDMFDGGYGVVPSADLWDRLPPGFTIHEMVVYDEDVLEKNAWGLSRPYPNCPAYDDATVYSIIESGLNRLKQASSVS